MDKAALIHELDAYMDYIAFARDHYEAYISLLSACATDNEKINLAPGFFQIARYALVYGLMMRLSTLYDRSETDSTLKALIKQVQVFANTLDNEVLREMIVRIIDRAQMAIVRMEHKTLVTLKKRRNKIYAHNDKAYFGKPEKMVQELWISTEEVEDLLTLASSFCADMINVLDDRIVAPFSANNDDLQNLLAHVHFL